MDTFIARYKEVTAMLSDPDVINDNKRFRKLSKEEADLRPKVQAFEKYEDLEEQIKGAEEILDETSDDEMEAMAKEELNDLKEQKEELTEDIKVMMLPSDPNDDKNIIMEIRGAAGGDEAQLFAADLFNMYSKYAEKQNWKIEVMSSSPNDIGGYKEIILNITGDKVYSKLKYESGAHRVQRVPKTESQGRVHTSTANSWRHAGTWKMSTSKSMIRIYETDIYRSSGAAGSILIKTSSAVV